MALRLAEDPRAEALFVNAVNAALRTGYEAKRQLLARVAANALHDGAILDDAELLVNTLEDLEAPHIAALVRLEAEWLERLHTDVGVVNWGSSPEWHIVEAHVEPGVVAAHRFEFVMHNRSASASAWVKGFSLRNGEGTEWSGAGARA